MKASKDSAEFLKRVADSREKQKLLDKCYAELLPIIVAAIARKKRTFSELNSQQSALLRQAIQDAYSDYHKHLDSEKSKGEKLKALYSSCLAAQQTLSPVLCHQELLSEMSLSQQAITKYKHPYGLLMAFQDALYETASMIEPIASQKRPTSSKPTSRTLATMHLASMWQKLTGKLPGVSQDPYGTIRKGPFVKLMQSFMRYCDPDLEFSGSTVRNDLKLVKQTLYIETVQT